ncbi:MAG: glycosyltransferase family 2 protein [Saccharospirillum sp.]
MPDIRQMGVIITTYNSPEWLHKVLIGYGCQTDTDFRVIIADDGSTQETADVIEQHRDKGILTIDYVWHEDQGFRKCTILNKAISETDCDYLIFTDGDCIPRADFIATHRAMAEDNTFLSGGYIKLTMPVSTAITEDDITTGRVFERDWLVHQGQPNSHKLSKLTHKTWLKTLMNRITPTKPTWNGMNSSTWRKHLIEVNGFNEDMQYGGLDRELGERLWNLGLRSKQIRYSAVCLHLDHPRGYAKPEIWAKNNAIRARVKKEHIKRTDNGINKPDSAVATQ